MKKQIYYLVASCYTLDVPEIPVKAVNALKSMSYSIAYTSAEINALAFENEAHERINMCRQRVKDIMKSLEDEANCQLELTDGEKCFGISVNGVAILDIEEAKVSV